MRHQEMKLKHWQKITHNPLAPKNSKKSRQPSLIRVYLGKQYPGVYWTRREAECIYYLAKNKRRKSIAAILRLSVRTIDFYIETAKAKLNCHSQRELLGCLPKTNFFSTVNRLKNFCC